MSILGLKEIAPRLFNIFALSLPNGLDFGNLVPVSSWMSEDELGCGLITYDENSKTYALLAMRRREDDVWVVVKERLQISGHSTAKALLEKAVRNGERKEPVPNGNRRHKYLHDLQRRNPSDIFKILSNPVRHSAAWTLNQVYLALPKPDQNFVSDFQTGNFHTRLWELYLLACFREQGLEIFQDHKSPDFHLRNWAGEAFVEAVTANPEKPYNHANSQPVFAPVNPVERQLGEAAFRYAKTLRSKLQKNYHKMPHVIGKPFAIGIADFHAPSSMTWSREALPSYLYGSSAQVEEKDGKAIAINKPAERLMVKGDIPAGLFCDPQNNYLSAVIHSNAGTIAKFNRMGYLAGYQYPGLKIIRTGLIYDKTPGALEGIGFDLDITSEEYSALWPNGEEWSTELEIYHNPNALHPFPMELLPLATHWFEHQGEIVCRAHYENTVLSSVTLLKMDKDELTK